MVVNRDREQDIGFGLSTQHPKIGYLIFLWCIGSITFEMLYDQYIIAIEIDRELKIFVDYLSWQIAIEISKEPERILDLAVPPLGYYSHN
jgi:hypothetical protein